VQNQNPTQPERYEAPQPAGTGLPAGTSGSPWDAWTGPAQSTAAARSVAGTQAVAGAQPVAVARPGYLTMAFVWMFLALLVSAVVAGLTVSSPGAMQLVTSSYFLLLIAELGLVIALSAAINRLSPTVAVAMLFVYAALNGATLSGIVLVYTTGSITGAFVGAAAVFGAAAVYGAVTSRDLTSLGGLLFAGLIGILVMSLVNLFIGGSSMSFVIGIIGVLVFTGLTAWDVQMIRSGRWAWISSSENASVLAALRLYLDFVNLFLMMLRITGSRS